MSSDVPCEYTRFGFNWGPLKVERMAEIDGRVVVCLKTDHQKVYVTSTPKGRKLHVEVEGE